MFDIIDQLKAEANKQLDAIRGSDELQQFHARYLGAKGAVKTLMTRLKEIPAEQKPAFGKMANELRQQLEQAFEDAKSKYGDTKAAATAKMAGIDVTEPGLPERLGREHVITQTINDLIDVFGRMGFGVATGPEVEDEFHNFIALNIPADHPARDPKDNFYLDGQHLLRSQTSTIQIRVMEKSKPPVRVVAMGRVYRPDEVDATHSWMFHQIEGLYVDRNVSMADLKTTLFQFARAYFGPEAQVRFRPSFFPFTEPSAEMDIMMNVRGTTRWVELGGCGMVDPNVFKAVGYDPEEYTGYAFGFGIERIAMRKFGITDIRWLYENDVRFLRQF